MVLFLPVRGSPVCLEREKEDDPVAMTEHSGI